MNTLTKYAMLLLNSDSSRVECTTGGQIISDFGNDFFSRLITYDCEMKASSEPILSKNPQKSPEVLKKRIRKLTMTIQTTSSSGCKCIKSQCQKSYCECFASGQRCGDQCQCSSCGNQVDPNENSFAALKRQLAGCTCKRSGCIKKYCECFLNGNRCGPLCKCVGCRNCQDFTTKANFQGELTGNAIDNCTLVSKLNELYRR